MLVWSPSGSCITIPSDWPRGMIVALWTGSAPSVRSATKACPPIVFVYMGRIEVFGE
jgi:hypothetical protein